MLALVLLVHGGVRWWAGEALVGWGLGDKPVPARMEVAFVRALAPSAAPAPAPAPMPRPAARARPRALEPAASAPALAVEPAPVEPAPIEPAPVPAPDVPPRAETAVAASAPAPEPPLVAAPALPAAASAAVPAAPAFAWPPSTRLTYKLSGNYRGEVHGSARVQWVRQDLRYQVHLDVAIGPSFAPLMSRRMTSDGTLGAEGLAPRRYDEQTKLPFQSERRATLAFGPDVVTLANGSQREALPGVQDAASQFVQLTWLFTTRPELLRVGNAIQVPLALPRRVDRWVYDVVGEDRLQTPLGALDTFHLKPRRADDRPRGELSAEVWFAPTLQYLPVRIRIQQDSETFVDLVLDGAPMQAEPPPR
ncbi:MAG TPA: DUF3108 domain-containing protein [Burkholderiaceae bacterium]|nr:DUF3108 domain-containing protein [Burkholderiaceae bacterium]